MNQNKLKEICKLVILFVCFKVKVLVFGIKYSQVIFHNTPLKVGLSCIAYFSGYCDRILDFA